MTIMARFSGTCPECGNRWQPGDLIRSEQPEPGELPLWQHAVCPDTQQDIDDARTPCARCFLIHPEGACDR